MAYLPIYLDVTNRPCLVIGGGEVAWRKVMALLEAGAIITVVSPTLIPELEQLKQARRCRHIEREYQAGDLNQHHLVYDASDDVTLHRALALEARNAGILLNVADQPEFCSFIVPSVVRRGDLQIAISTGGGAPAMARWMRQRLEAEVGVEYEALLEILRAARRWLQDHDNDLNSRRRALEALLDANLLAILRSGRLAALEPIVKQHLGGSADFKALGLDPRRLEEILKR